MVSQSPLHQALSDALDDEYKARATYQMVIDAFGPVLPFANIIQSEQRHIDALLSLLAGRSLPAIADPYAAGIAAPSSIQDACRIGVGDSGHMPRHQSRVLRSKAGPLSAILMIPMAMAARPSRMPIFSLPFFGI
ncbi:DUF2202 domain-containing protein [Paramagnetospirillum kuznetsovii]|uniref:DUF2202 domain-containing protein n=1 Tax=Paramagnetospirillum kuznetsovii TaxID=2053833 RepID=A0A364NT32_9PROT|nr:DUF2202 domain-containing protein [Paramagnetospirillum kuznetsovii]RAU20228.1 DUF2202 domain-containing protein [Paramagnetospirillum kuznetsovii]